MYIKVGEEFADGELWKLEELLELLDSRLMPIHDAIAKSKDPESDGLLDRGEYFVGVGFCAIQQYLVDTLTLTGVSKSEALGLGSPISQELSLVAVINAAANWWKHSAEWVGLDNLPRPARRTADVVLRLSGGAEEYALSNVLTELVDSAGISLGALLPGLRAWRADVERLVAAGSGSQE